ncbi:hypothetical protein [Wolbachia endosymbiont (group A) of Conops quadrifasciatus]|uniref:hypothetical protein n=1 Tax=Wolbachia endosymbiont (group A) of Conops quadrifasciatus TaxID=3066143 RepID=UPI003132FD6A
MRHHVGAAEVGAAESGSAGTSAWTQQTNSWSPKGTSGNKWQPLQFTEPGSSGSLWTQSSSELSSWKSANKSGSAWTSTRGSYSSPPTLMSSSGGIVPRFRPPIQVSSSEPSSSKGANESGSAGTNTCTQNPCSSSKGADKSARTTWYVSFPLTTGNDPMSSSLGVFADSPSVKGKESIFSVEPEKQQVTDKSNRESSDECSEAKSQKSEFPSSQKESKSNLSLDRNTSSRLRSIGEHLIGKFFKKKKGSKNNSFSDGSTPSGFLEDTSFERNNEERDSISSSVSAPGGFVSKKPPLSKRSHSERKAKSNPPSKVTSPVHSTINGSIPGLPSQGVVGKLNMPGDRSSKIFADSGLGSLERKQSLPLTEEFSDSSQQNLLIGVKLGNMLSELLNSAQNLLKNPASSTHKGVPGGPKRQTSLTSSQREELYKVLSDEVKEKLNSSSFPPGYEKLLHLLYVDKRELRLLLSEPKAKEQVCSVLSLPPEKMEQVQSSSPEEVLHLLHTFFSNQKISDNFLISSKVDSPKTEKHLQEEREVFV